MRIVKALSLALLIASLFSSLSFAAQQDRISESLTSGQRHVLKGNVRHQALPEYDQGRVDPGMRLGTMTLLTAPTATQESAIKQLLAQQQDRKSPNYHKWITPAQFADRFGLSPNDMQQLVAWLSSQGFTMIEPAHGRNWISFTGTAAQVESAFGTEIHHFNVKGELHYANATPPQIPAALAGIVVGVRGLDDFHPRPMGIRRVRPDYFYSGTQFSGQYIAPGDIYTIYDINPLLNATPTKIDGTGQKVAIMGATDIYLSDLTAFRTGFGLPAISCTAPSNVITACSDPHFSYVLGGADPGLVGGDVLAEADLDLEWSGATAPGAQLIFVNSTDAFTSFYYAIDHQDTLGESVISLSFGACEFDLNIGQLQPGQPALFETELLKASAEGITFVNSSGDSGAAECDDNSTLTASGLATGGLAVAYPASSPEVTGVGGTAVQLADLSSTAGYWGTTNGPNGGSILPTGPENGYIPEQAWNDDDEFAQLCSEQASGSNGYVFCQTGDEPAGSGWVPITSSATAQANFGIGSDGGGASNCAVQNSTFTQCVSGFPQPGWQTVTVSGQTTRMSPDISLLATPNFTGYVFCSDSSCAGGISAAVGNNSIIGGTSASAPIFAGIVALLNQFTGSAQGPINPMLYQLAATAPSAFHDITSGDNNVACEYPDVSGQLPPLQCPSTKVVGYSAGPGFDMATGLGSVDVNQLAVALKNPPDFSVSSSTSSLSVFAGQSGTATITVTPVNNFSGPLSFSCSGPTGITCSFSPSSVTPDGGPANTTATVTAGDSATNGSVVIDATTSLGTSGTASHVSNAAPSIALTVASPFSLALPTSNFQVTQGNSVPVTVNVTLAGGFTGTVSFTCNDPAPESVCTVPTPINASGPVSFSISTTAPTASLQPPGRGTGIFYATLLPGLLGLMLTAGTRRRSLRGMRFLALILVMGFSTMWLASCGGSSGGNSNKGTPTGPYTFSVTATSGGATVTSPQFTVTVGQ